MRTRRSLLGALGLCGLASCLYVETQYDPGAPEEPAGTRERPQLGGADGLQTVDSVRGVEPGPMFAAPDVQTLFADGGMAAVVRRYSADFGSVRRIHDLSFSMGRLEVLQEFFTVWRSQLDTLAFEEMGQDDRIDAILFRGRLDYELRQVAIDAKRIEAARPLLPFADALIELHEARRRLEPIVPADVAAQLADLVRQVESTREELEDAEDVSPTVANRAVRYLDDVRSALRRWYQYHHDYDPLFTWWAEEPYGRLNRALSDYGDFLREELVGASREDTDAIIGDPIGREALLSELAYEMIPYTPEELVKIAQKEFEWCDREMLRASNDLGFGDDWKAALEHVKTLHVEPGDQPALIRDMAIEAVDFLEERDLMTIPTLAKNSWRMEMMSPERQKITPFFTGGEVISVSFPTRGMEHEDKLMSLRGNNIHFSRATVHHELIPGHHLQGFMTARYKTHRRAYATSFWGEGWALYWEMLLWDMDFQRSAEDRIGMLFWRMHRCARIVFSLGFHLETMTPQECIDFLIDRVGHEEANASAEVRRSFRGDYGPLYQCAYMLGGLQFRALHEELVQSGKMTNREFHDAILREHRIPVEMVRAKLTGQELSRDFRSSWKFYGEDF